MTRNWEGLQDDQTGAGDETGLINIIGVNYYADGQLSRRPGLTAITNLGGIALGTYKSAVSGTWLLVITSSGTIESVSL